MNVDFEKDEAFDNFQKHANAFATHSHILTTKGKSLDKRFCKESKMEIFSSPAFCDDDNRGKQFAYESINKLQAHCEPCESSCLGYGKAGKGSITKQIIADSAKMQHSNAYFVDLINRLIDNRSYYADFLVLLRHRCLKLPLNHLASQLAQNTILFTQVLQYFLCGFGNDAFALTKKEQHKAEEVVTAFLKCPTLSEEFDTTNGRLLLDAVLSPYTTAAKMVITDKRVVWRENSHLEIIEAMKDGHVFEDTRLFLLNYPPVYKKMTEDDRTRLEVDPKVERFFQ